ncbi:MAG: hypothetical protein ACREDA_11330, partial [Methylocella sp.]
HMPIMIKDKGGVNADVFHAFLQQLITGARGVIFLTAGRGPAQAAKKTRAFVESLNGSPRLIYLPPYSPDRTPGALRWKHLKADTAGRMAVSSNDDFESKVRSSVRQLQNDPAKIRSFYQKPPSDTPRKGPYTYELINTVTNPATLHALEWQFHQVYPIIIIALHKFEKTRYRNSIGPRVSYANS